MNMKNNIIEDEKLSKEEIEILESNFKELQNIYESVTGYEYDHTDIKWNEFVLEAIRARNLWRKVTLHVMNYMFFIAVVYIAGTFIFHWFELSDPLLDTGIISSFLRLKSHNVVFSRAVSIMTLCFILMPYGPFGIAWFKMRKKISLARILSKIIKVAKGREIYNFVVSIILVALILFIAI